MSTLKELFLLNPDVIFLNHGSFGACPRPVFEAYQRWQRELEYQPVEFLGRRLPDLLAQARQRLGTYLNVAADDLVYVTNATTGINIVARSLPLQPGDEVLATNQEYGAVDRTWTFVCRKTGAKYVRQPIPTPVHARDALVDLIWRNVTPRTRVISLSHITSSTAMIMPIEEICRRARQAGILTVIDGAHAVGQIPLDLPAIGADFYAGNCHKWLCAPKGAGFLYARPDAQALIEPLVVSWGWESPRPGPSRFIDYHQWQGTRDISAFLAVPAAIDFMIEHDWDSVRQACHELARQVRRRLADLTGLPPNYPDHPDWYAQMVTAPLPPGDLEALKARLYDEYRIEVPFPAWNDQQGIRVSIQGYNTQQDIDTLIDALTRLLPQVSTHEMTGTAL